MPKDTRHFSELLQAVRDNNLEQVKTIWEGHIRSQNNKNGGQLCRATSTGYAAVLLLAATLPDDKIMRYLIATTLDLNYLGDPYVDGVAHRSLETITPLHAAVRAGSLAAVTALLEANADADRVDGHGRTPLHTAAMRADCRTARMLLYRGAHVQKTDSDGLVPMQMAARYGHVELVRVLLEHGATVFHEGQCGPSPLHIAAAEGHLPLVDLFLRYVNVNSQVSVAHYRSHAPLPQPSPTPAPAPASTPLSLPRPSPTPLSHAPLPRPSPTPLSHAPLPRPSPTPPAHQ